MIIYSQAFCEKDLENKRFEPSETLTYDPTPATQYPLGRPPCQLR
jgi:hypothetical protein